MSRADAIGLAYLVTIVTFVLALRFLSSPTTARRGNQIGAVSFAGRLIGFGKLQELVSGRPITYPGQKLANGALLAALVGVGIASLAGPQRESLVAALILGALVFGVLFVLPIGGADMPV